ncbi:hypothetical protein F4820DRAFT_464875 [Hypoxylon rubiginosum]|uniref:Uncharacterized protein n=1 Tax=Hypoxylon rubiginosum TaxID=110542 RepID=A0ACB9YQH2_9PEZI|nr:hypothetical protein F4820DRAFT_464875 [Hypoxylon rubiginosum]
MKKSNEESQGLLPREAENLRLNKSRHHGRRRFDLGLSPSFASLSIFLMLLSTIVVVTVDIAYRAQLLHDRAMRTLPTDALRFEERPEWSQPIQHPWSLEPSDELDAAWDDLLYPLNIRVTGDELDMLGQNKTNRLQINRGDYLGVLGALHYLHCLNNIRKVIHWDYYESRTPDDLWKTAFGKGHSDHCIDSIRQTLMCRANTQIITAEWVDYDNDLGGREARSDTVTTCVNWESLDNWARQRALRKGNFSYRPRPFKITKTNDTEETNEEPKGPE